MVAFKTAFAAVDEHGVHVLLRAFEFRLIVSHQLIAQREELRQARTAFGRQERELLSFIILGPQDGGRHRKKPIDLESPDGGVEDRIRRVSAK